MMRPFVPISEHDRPVLTAFLAARGWSPATMATWWSTRCHQAISPTARGSSAGKIQADQKRLPVTRPSWAGRLGGTLREPAVGADRQRPLYVQPFSRPGGGDPPATPTGSGDCRIRRRGRDRGHPAGGLGGAVRRARGDAGTPGGGGRAALRPRPSHNPEEGGTAADEAARLLARANQLFKQADAALEENDLATFQERLNQARDLVSASERALAGDEEAASRRPRPRRQRSRDVPGSVGTGSTGTARVGGSEGDR